MINKIVFLITALALIGCSSSPKKEEVVVTKEASSVEENTTVADATLEDDLETLEEEIEIVEVNDYESDGNLETTEILSEASNVQTIQPATTTYYPETFANTNIVQPVTQIQEVRYVGASGCGTNYGTHQVVYNQPSCGGKVIYDNQITVTQQAAYVESADVIPTAASGESFLAGFYQFPKSGNGTPVYALPNSSSAIVNSIAPGKVLWVENHGGQWAKVFRRSGPAYILKDNLSQ